MNNYSILINSKNTLLEFNKLNVYEDPYKTCVMHRQPYLVNADKIIICKDDNIISFNWVDKSGWVKEKVFINV